MSHGNKSTRITVNAGGHHYETTTATLCRCAFFQDLLTANTTPPTKKQHNHVKAAAAGAAAVSAQPQAQPRSTIFVDCDGDLFADILFFLRRQVLPAATLQNNNRLIDVVQEAEYLHYDALLQYCLQHTSTNNMPLAEAQSYPMTIRAPDIVWLHVPARQLLHVVSAVHVDYEDRQECDSYLSLQCGELVTTIAHSSRTSTGTCSGGCSSANHHHLPLSIRSSEEYQDRVGLLSSHGRWDVICWVGHASQIPGLQGTR
jgi:hypothetical protein